MVTISLYFVHCAISCIRYAKLASQWIMHYIQGRIASYAKTKKI